MGPIDEWWITGFDSGENALIGFSTGMSLLDTLYFHWNAGYTTHRFIYGHHYVASLSPLSLYQQGELQEL